MNVQARKRFFWWGLSSVYVVLLYLTLPLGRPAITFMRQHLDATQQSYLMYGVFAVAGAGLLVYLLTRIKTLAPQAFVCFIIMGLLYKHEFTTLMTYPEERLHFLEYGVLALMLFKSFSVDFSGIWPYIGAACLGAVIGLGDEGVQYSTKYLPDLFQHLGIDSIDPHQFRRYFGWGDVKLNALGVLYGLALLATVFRNKRTHPTPADCRDQS